MESIHAKTHLDSFICFEELRQYRARLAWVESVIFAVISGHVFKNTHSKTCVCTRFSVPALQTQRPRVHVPCPLQRLGFPGQLKSSTCCTRLLTKSGCRSGSSLVLFSVDLISKMQCSSMPSTSPSRKSVKLSASCNRRHNSQLAATF